MEILSVQERKAQLEKWEKSRKNERFSVVFSLFPSFFTALAVAVGSYNLAKHSLGDAFAADVSVVLALAPLFYWLALYLQTWGSYVERRIEDIEAKIDGRSPVYYVREDNASFSRQPLHERLERIESILSQLRRPTKC